MNAYEVFISLTDQIYFSGYSEMADREDTQKSNFEWNEFLVNYEPAN